ncbi:MAG TPA: DUF4911 domain-containing protein [Candidatus Acidoferrales bacterium]|nr:DUF4911 domain-containing protein [Candidatus Acidoferrales bacterium]
MKLHEIYLELSPEDIAYVKFVVESYEGVGIVRTVDRKKAVIVLLATESFLPTARQLADALKKEVPLSEVPRPADLPDDWLMRELATSAAEPS